MKTWLVVSFLFVSVSSFGQDMKAIGHELAKSFNDIDTLNIVSRGLHPEIDFHDSVTSANEEFALKLKQYTSKVPQTLAYSFPELSQTEVKIVTSPDGKLRIYSWDDMNEGSMRFFINVFQYKGDKVHSQLSDTGNIDGEIINTGVYYSNIFQLNFGSRTVYIAQWHGNGSSIDYSAGIQLFEVSDSILNDKVKMIKTKSGFSSGLHFEYDLTKVPENIGTLVRCEDNGKTIKIPVVNAAEAVTGKWITYKFDGQYYVPVFEKKKSKGKGEK